MPTILATLALSNPGFETGDMSGWTISDASVIANTFNGDNFPHSGTYLGFAGTTTPTSFWQDKDVSAYASDIDTGRVTLSGYGAWHATYGPQTDHGHLFATFLNGLGAAISTAVTADTHPDDWTLEILADSAVPSGTRTIRLGVVSIRDAGANNDNYWDDFTGPNLTTEAQAGALALAGALQLTLSATLDARRRLDLSLGFHLGLSGLKDPPFDCTVAPAKAWTCGADAHPAAWIRQASPPTLACDGADSDTEASDLALVDAARLTSLDGLALKLIG